MKKKSAKKENQSSETSEIEMNYTCFAKDWQLALSPYLESEAFEEVIKNFKEEKAQGKIINPPSGLIFRAFKKLNLADLKVVIIGQEPYTGPGQANGLAFAVNEGMPRPPSLRNILSEVETDLQTDFNLRETTLEGWEKQGVLLLNSVLTVEEGVQNSHAEMGWKKFTDFVVKTISDQKDHVVFMMWGKSAQEKFNLINPRKHPRLTAAHPSPLSARKGFFGCRHFSEANTYLSQWGKNEIDWTQINDFNGHFCQSEDEYTKILGV